MFYTKITDDTFQAIENDIKRFLFDNFDKLTIEKVSIGGQSRSNNIIFYDAKTSQDTVVLDFKDAFYNILDKYVCYTDWYVCLHGHYVSIIEKHVLKGVEFECVHYKLEKLSPQGRLTGNVRYLGRLYANEVPHEKLEGINETLLKKHRSLIKKYMR